MQIKETQGPRRALEVKTFVTGCSEVASESCRDHGLQAQEEFRIRKQAAADLLN